MHLHAAELDAARRPRLSRYVPGQWMVAADNRARRANLERVQELYAAHGDEVTVFCSHDASELAALQTS